MRPFKQSLLNNVKRWSYAFKKHLTDHVVKSLADLNNFIEKADEGLMQQVKEGDYEGLIKVMEILKIVKEKQATTDTMFEPLSKIIDMLKGYGVVIPEESLVQLTGTYVAQKPHPFSCPKWVDFLKVILSLKYTPAKMPKLSSSCCCVIYEQNIFSHDS